MADICNAPLLALHMHGCVAEVWLHGVQHNMSSTILVTLACKELHHVSNMPAHLIQSKARVRHEPRRPEGHTPIAA